MFMLDLVHFGIFIHSQTREAYWIFLWIFHISAFKYFSGPKRWLSQKKNLILETYSKTNARMLEELYLSFTFINISHWAIFTNTENIKKFPEIPTFIMFGQTSWQFFQETAHPNGYKHTFILMPNFHFHFWIFFNIICFSLT